MPKGCAQADMASIPTGEGSGGRASANPTGPQAGSQLLAGEEGFSLPADRIYTERTAQSQLRGAQLV